MRSQLPPSLPPSNTESNQKSKGETPNRGGKRPLGVGGLEEAVAGMEHRRRCFAAAGAAAAAATNACCSVDPALLG
jgi:hypothetical protein